MSNKNNSSKGSILIICPFPKDVAAGQRLKYEQYLNHWRENGYEITKECRDYLKPYVMISFGYPNMILFMFFSGLLLLDLLYLNALLDYYQKDLFMISKTIQ